MMVAGAIPKEAPHDGTKTGWDYAADLGGFACIIGDVPLHRIQCNLTWKSPFQLALFMARGYASWVVPYVRWELIKALDKSLKKP